MSLRTAVANATSKKVPPAPKCGALARKRDDLKKALASVEESLEKVQKAEKAKLAEAKKKLEQKQKAEHDKLEKKHQAEEKKLEARYGCLPTKPRPRKPRAKKEAQAKTASPSAKKASKKKASKKASAKSSDSAIPQPRAVPQPPRAAKTSKAREVQARPLVVIVDADTSTGDLSVNVDGGSLRRALGLVRRLHVHSGFVPYNAVTFTARDSSLRLHVRAELGELQVTIPGEVAQPGVVRTSVEQLRRLAVVANGTAARVRVQGDLLEVSQGGVASRAALEDIAEPPMSGQGKIVAQVDVDPAVLERALDAVVYDMSQDPARVSITGLLYERHAAGSTFVATDGHRLVAHEDQVPWVGPQGSEHMVLEGHEVRHLQGLLRGALKAAIAFTPHYGRQVITVAGVAKDLAWTLVIPEKVQDAEGTRVVFPPYRQVIPSTFTSICRVPASTFREALEPLVKTEGVNEKRGKVQPHAHVTYKDGHLELVRSDLAGEGIKTTLPLRCTPPDEAFVVGMRPGYLLEAVSHGPMAKSDVIFEFAASKDSINPVKLRAAGEGWSTTAVIMPFRM